MLQHRSGTPAPSAIKGSISLCEFRFRLGPDRRRWGRALIALMVYSFARIGAALGMAVEDVYTHNRLLWVRLRE